jgi:hypothetical protein
MEPELVTAKPCEVLCSRLTTATAGAEANHEMSRSPSSPPSAPPSSPWYLCGCCCGIQYTNADGLSLHKPPSWVRNSKDQTSTTQQMILEEESPPGDEDPRYPNFIRESTRSIDLNDTITLEELQKIIPSIDQDLEKNIKSWEDSFRKYEELENKSLEVIGPELVRVLEKLRDDPDAFLNSSNPAIRSLARTRTSLYSPTSRRDSKDSIMSLEIEDSVGSNGRRKSLTASATPLSSSLPPPLSTPTQTQRRGSLPDLRPLSMNSVISHSYTERASELLNYDSSSPEVVSNSKEGTKLVFGNRRIQSVALTRRSVTGPLVQTNPIHPSMGRRELSLIWAGRLAELSPSQGQLSKQVGRNGQVLSLKMTPKWPSWLSDCLYDVIKTNKYGKRQRRVLQLTEFHVLNIKDGKSVTKVIPYGGIHRINLTSARAFTIDYEIKLSGQEIVETGTLYYESLLSAHIVQQVTTRTQIRRDLDKIGQIASSEEIHRLGYSVGVTENMIQTITELVTTNNSDITQFALLLGRRTYEQLLSLQPHLIVASPPSPSSPLVRRHTTNEATALSRRLLEMQQGSGEHRLKTHIQKIILDVQSPEGNTLRHFLHNFPSVPKDKNITELRHFIDGLYEYLIENHVNLFATSLRSDEGTRPEEPTTAPPSESTATSALAISTLTTAQQLTEDHLVSISYIAYTVVEETLFLALQPNLISYCLSYETREVSLISTLSLSHPPLPPLYSLPC